VDVLRQSWDFNENASGMTFFNPFNSEIIVDGQPDNVDTSLYVPVKTWGLTTGDPGSVYTYSTFRDTAWSAIALYYRDNENGGQSDGTWIDSIGGDTGDNKSYGDYGTIFRNLLSNRAMDLDLGFEAYFLPHVMTRDDGLLLTQNIEYPVSISVAHQAFSSAVRSYHTLNPDLFTLSANYPNPFNSTTHFNIHISRKSELVLSIINSHGQNVRVWKKITLPAGFYQMEWDGTDDKDLDVPSGIYIIRAQIDQTILSRKVILVK
jgi:hypothetical protein